MIGRARNGFNNNRTLFHACGGKTIASRSATPWNSVKSAEEARPLSASSSFGEKLTFQSSSGNDRREIDIYHFSHPPGFSKMPPRDYIGITPPFGCRDATINPSFRRIESFADESISSILIPGIDGWDIFTRRDCTSKRLKHRGTKEDVRCLVKILLALSTQCVHSKII